jgi:hypothetical protein
MRQDEYTRALTHGGDATPHKGLGQELECGSQPPVSWQLSY